MKTLLKTISYLGLALSVVPAFFLFRGVIGGPIYQGLMVAGMILWFGTAVFWIKPPEQERPEATGEN